MGRFINADVDVATGHGLLGNNMFAYCGNNPVNNTDSSGEDWWHWAVAAAVVVAAAVAVVATAGGATGAFVAITSVSNGVSTCSTAATVAAGVFISSATALATNTYMAASESSSLEEFAAHGEAAMYSTIVSGVYGGSVAYVMSRTQSPSECFVAGTLVKTSDGNRLIEEIVAGDYVWAWDEATGDVALKEVIETYVNETSELIHLFVNGEEIITTPTHPFYSPVKGWTDAVNLRAGDILVLVNGEYVVVEKIQHEILESPVTVYNFNVSDYHTYYVTGGVLVHNACERGVGGKGWKGDSTWRENVRTVENGGDILELNGGIPTATQASQLILESGGTVGAYHNAHPVGGISTHTYDHIHYVTYTGIRSAIQVIFG